MQSDKWEIIHILSTRKNSGRKQTTLVRMISEIRLMIQKCIKGQSRVKTVRAAFQNFHLGLLVLDNISISSQRSEQNQCWNVCGTVFGLEKQFRKRMFYLTSKYNNKRHSNKTSVCHHGKLRWTRIHDRGRGCKAKCHVSNSLEMQNKVSLTVSPVYLCVLTSERWNRVAQRSFIKNALVVFGVSFPPKTNCIFVGKISLNAHRTWVCIVIVAAQGKQSSQFKYTKNENRWYMKAWWCCGEDIQGALDRAKPLWQQYQVHCYFG